MLEPVAPLVAIAALIWDEPAFRSLVTVAWRNATRTADVRGRDWKNVTGPVGVAVASLRRVGADWHKPFAIKVLDRSGN